MFEKGQKHELQFERIVFFSDAVFAIAITLLIIEVKVPHLEHGVGSREFALGLLRLLPNFIGFFVSFVVTGAYWVGHHRVYGMIVDWNYGLIWRNILFLLTIAFMPFATAFFSEYWTEFVPMLVYGLTFSAAGFMQIIQFRYAIKNNLLDPAADTRDAQILMWRMSVLPAAGLFAILIAVFAPFFAGMAFLLIPIAHRIIKARFVKPTATESDMKITDET